MCEVQKAFRGARPEAEDVCAVHFTAEGCRRGDEQNSLLTDIDLKHRCNHNSRPGKTLCQVSDEKQDHSAQEMDFRFLRQIYQSTSYELRM